tara:strand:+ start:1079 stop:1918 length:840 start_codon:yes stop_codon:yes gene_type:complete
MPSTNESTRSKRETKRFTESIAQLLIQKKLSQRKACEKLEITIGTMTKYLRGEVNPFDVKTRITRNLAHELDITPEALYTFFETGAYKDSVTLEDVESWIKSTSSTEDFPRILDALSHSTQGHQAKYVQWLNGSKNQKEAVQKKSKEEEKSILKPKKPNKSEVAKFSHLMTVHFKEIARTEVLSTKEAWQLFLKQDYAKGMSEKDLDLTLDILRGETILELDITLELGASYGRCPITTCLRTMSSLEFTDEYQELLMKIESYCCYKLTGTLPESAACCT